MDILVLTFGVPFLIGIVLGFCFKGMINRYEKRRAFDRHLNELHRSYNEEF